MDLGIYLPFFKDICNIESGFQYLKARETYCDVKLAPNTEP
jgi:hypothetical protein